jgi:Flp pilus assembly protein TadD
MIVKNESRCLADCLESVRGIADEIAIGDTGSTDDTMAIAKRFGARCISIAWQNDFASARNQCLATATGDWLLHLDADEAVDTAGAQRIRELVDQDGAGADAIEVTLANYSDEMRAWRWTPAPPGDPMARGFSGYIAAPLLRLFRNHRGYQYREPVHENITESVLELGGRIRSEPILIHHYGYAVRADEKARLYLSIARQKAEKRPDDPKAWHDLSEQLLALGETEESAVAAANALRLDPNHVGAATTLATIHLNAGNLEVARNGLETLVSRGIAPAHVLTALAAIACKQGRIEDARTLIDAAVDRDARSIMGHLYRARILDIQGDACGAEEELAAALALAPALEEVQQRKRARTLRCEADEMQTEGNNTGALTVYVKALKLDSEDPLIHLGIGRVSRELGQTDAAQRCFSRAQALCPWVLDSRCQPGP